jgi:catechol 2,3-dioxygenase-like lactoylglutathione lyase family enzyme
MFDHLALGVSDLAASKAFYLQALAPLGITAVMEFPETAGLGIAPKPSF